MLRCGAVRAQFGAEHGRRGGLRQQAARSVMSSSETPMQQQHSSSTSTGTGSTSTVLEPLVLGALALVLPVVPVAPAPALAHCTVLRSTTVQLVKPVL
jgi:hypothetical protein